jgi:hypothetical protein
LIVFLSLWLVGWALGELAVVAWVVIVPLLLIESRFGMLPPGIRDKIAHDAGESWAEVVLVGFVWLPFWTLAGIIAYRALRWQLGGREVILIHEGILELRREAGRRRRSESFELSGLRNLRYAPEPAVSGPTLSLTKSLRAAQVFLRSEGGSIAFDHGQRTHRFGISLGEAEARRLVATIRARFKIEDDRCDPLPVET